VAQDVTTHLFGQSHRDGRLTYTGHRGAIVHMGMAVMAHHAATLVRIHQYRLSKRAHTFRRRLRLRCRNVKQCNASILNT
jgi:hypothetical protein